MHASAEQGTSGRWPPFRLDRGTRRERHDVRYKDEQGKHRSKTFRLKNEAKAFEAEATRLEQRRQMLVRHGVDLGTRDRTTVLAHVEDWLARYGRATWSGAAAATT